MRIALNTDDGDEITAGWDSTGSALELVHSDPVADTHGYLLLSAVDLDDLITGLSAMREARPR